MSNSHLGVTLLTHPAAASEPAGQLWIPSEHRTQNHRTPIWSRHTAGAQQMACATLRRGRTPERGSRTPSSASAPQRARPYQAARKTVGAVPAGLSASFVYPLGAFPTAAGGGSARPEVCWVRPGSELQTQAGTPPAQPRTHFGCRTGHPAIRAGPEPVIGDGRGGAGGGGLL